MNENIVLYVISGISSLNLILLSVIWAEIKTLRESKGEQIRDLTKVITIIDNLDCRKSRLDGCSYEKN